MAAMKPTMIGICMGVMLSVLWMQLMPLQQSHSATEDSMAAADASRKLATDAPKASAPIQPFETPGAEPDKNYVLILTLLRVAAIVYIGPCVTFYGCEMTKAACFVQAGTASGFWGWYGKLQSIAYVGDVPPVIEDLAKVLFMTSTAGLSMMIWESIRLAIRGILIAYTFIMQIMPIIEVELLDWAGCEAERFLPAATIRNQPYDAWVGCTNEGPYYVAMWLMKLMEWSFIGLGAACAFKLKKYLSAASSAMVGADMIAAGIEALITDVMSLTSSDKEVADALQAFAAIRMFLCYGLFAYGCVCQFSMTKWWADGYHSKHDNPEVTTIKDLRWFVKPIAYLNFLVKPMFKFNAFLAGGVEAIVQTGAETASKLVSSKTSGAVTQKNRG